MKTTAFALALMLGGTAAAQTADPAANAYEGDGQATLAWESDAAAAGTTIPAAIAAETVPAETAQRTEPSNANPERDARGIAVISAAAVAPAGWNGVPASAMGGPELDPATGEAMAPDSYPACTATVTDKCLQTYERGRSA
jgi:hypothetical protein